MYTLYSLPPELQLRIIKEMTTESLFKLAADSDPKANGTPRFMFDQARIELFRRRGAEAGKFQYKLLGSWNKHWNLYQKLSFIKSDKDKDKWVDLLQNAIKDPEVSLDDKCRFSSFINKLIGAPDEITPKIHQSIMSDLEKKCVSGKFQLIISELRLDEEMSLIDTLQDLLKSKFYTVQVSAIEMLASIGSLASRKVKEDIITLLLNIQIKPEWYSDATYLASMAGLISFASLTQKKQMHELFLSYISHSDYRVRDEAIKCIAELSKTATQAQIAEMVKPLLEIINYQDAFGSRHSDTETVRMTAIKMLAIIGQYIKNNDAVISALIRCLSINDDEIILEASETLAKLKAYASESKKQEIYNLLIKEIYDPKCNELEYLMSLITYASESQRDEIADYVM